VQPAYALLAAALVAVAAGSGNSAPTQLVPTPVTAAGYAPTFELTGAVQRPETFTRERLRQYSSFKIEVVFGSGNRMAKGIFVGVPLWELLQEVGVKTEPGRKNDLLRKYLLVTGSDGYQVVLALGEILPDFGGQPVLVAYQRDGKPLGSEEGMARLVVPNDKSGGRFVDHIVRIEVRDPEP